MMGIDVESFGNDQAELSMQVRPDMQNGVGWLQGGLYTAICDEAMALALFTILENGEQIATISKSTSYLERVRRGKIIAKGKVVKKGRHMAFTEGYVKKQTEMKPSYRKRGHLSLSSRNHEPTLAPGRNEQNPQTVSLHCESPSVPCLPVAAF
jgi:acyl-CoA thioesterase